jgi:hypothetical protein
MLVLALLGSLATGGVGVYWEGAFFIYALLRLIGAIGPKPT